MSCGHRALRVVEVHSFLAVGAATHDSLREAPPFDERDQAECDRGGGSRDTITTIARRRVLVGLPLKAVPGPRLSLNRPDHPAPAAIRGPSIS